MLVACCCSLYDGKVLVCSLFCVWCLLLSVFECLVFGVPLFVVRCLLLVACCSFVVRCCLSFDGVRCLLFVVRCLLFVVCC